MPESAASMLNPRPWEVLDPENLGGSTRVNGLAVVRRRFRIPTRFRVGERPAGAERGVVFEGSIRGAAGDRAESIFLGDVTGLMAEEKSLGEGGARVTKKFCGLQRGEDVALLEPSGHLDRLGERKMTGSMFSLFSLSES